MRNILNLVGGTLFIAWVVAYFGYAAGEKSHILLVLAIVVFFLKTFIYAGSNGK